MKKIIKFPILRQVYNYDCGADAVQSVLDYYGIDVREGIIMKLARTKKSGTNISGIKKVLRYFGLSYKEGKMSLEDLKKFLDKKIPVIMAIQAWAEKKDINWENTWKDGHYVVAIGYDDKKFYFADPSCERKTFLNFNQLKERWHDKDTKNKKIRNWGLAVWRNKYAKDPHLEISKDYKKPGKKYRYNEEQTVPMG